MYYLVKNYSWVENAADPDCVKDCVRKDKKCFCNKEKLKAGMSKITTALKSGSGYSGVLFGVPDNRGFGGSTTTASMARKVFKSLFRVQNNFFGALWVGINFV